LRYGARKVTILASNELSDEHVSQSLQNASGIFLLDDPQETLRNALLAEGERYALYVREFADRLPVMASSGGHILGVGGLNLLPAVVCESLESSKGMPALIRTQVSEHAVGFGLKASSSITFNRGLALMSGKDSVLCFEPELEKIRLMGDALPAVSGLLLHALPPKSSFDLIRRKARY
jgi:hypothetical protein